MQNAGIINLIAKVAAYYEINMKRKENVKICKCADVYSKYTNVRK